LLQHGLLKKRDKDVDHQSKNLGLSKKHL